MKSHPVDDLISRPGSSTPRPGWVCRWPSPERCQTHPPRPRPAEDYAAEVGSVVASPHHAAIGLVRGRQAARRAKVAEGEAHELAAELEAATAALRRGRRCPDV